MTHSTENFSTMSNVAMLVEEELAMETHAKTGWKGNYQNKDKMASGSSNKEVHVINHYMEYTPIRTTYTHALGCLLAKRKIDLPKIKPETEVTRRRKYFDLTNYFQQKSACNKSLQEAWH